MRWLRNSLLRLFMSKQAREKMDAYHAAQRQEPQLPREPASPPPPEPKTESELARAVDAAVAQIAHGEHIEEAGPLLRDPGRVDPSIGRAALIRNAMAIHKAQQSVLAGLDEETRRKLTAVAMQAFFNEKPKS